MTQDMASARAAFYPNINLSLDAISLSMGVGNLFKSPGQIVGGGPAISLPLFDAGRLRANLRSKTADVDAAVTSYNGVVLDAVREVADLVSTGQSLVKQQAEQQVALRTARDSQHIAQQRYDAGLITVFPVLAANSAVLAQERLTIDLQTRVLDNRAALWRALGSGGVMP
jgi:outer membrane protein TolC